MAAASVAHPTPADGALCLWKDVSGRSKPPARPGRRPVTAEADDCSSGDVKDCLRSCAAEWHKYVDGVGLAQPPELE